jgi:hypothetical protein
MSHSLLGGVVSDPVNCLGGVMVIVCALSAVDCGFEPRSGPTKDYIKLVFVVSLLSTVLRRKSKDSESG